MCDNDVQEKSLNECMELVNNRLYEVWQKKWDECMIGRVTYEFIREVRFAEVCREFEPNLSRGYILTGHE